MAVVLTVKDDSRFVYWGSQFSEKRGMKPYRPPG
jgi:hypothetical protein